MYTIPSGVKNSFRTLTAVVLFSALTLAAAAGTKKEKRNHPGNASAAEVSYIGLQGGSPLFHVQYANATGAKFSIKVLDGDGNQIFQGVYTDRDFNKRFKVLNTDNQDRITFVIRSFQDNSIQQFEVSSGSRLVEDVEVKEISQN